MKYQEIYQDLKKAILRRVLAPNEAVPSEKALTIKYGVSRITTKHALNKLADDGLIYRVQGKGSFVKEHAANKNRQILLVLPFSGHQDLGNYITGIQKVLQDTTWKLLSITNDELFKMDLTQIKKQYAGIIYYPQHIASDISKLLNLYLHKVPIVLLDQTIANSIIPSVTSDNIGGGFLATKHLIEIGRKKIAFYGLTNFLNDYTGSVAERFSGYLMALRKFNRHDFDPLQLLDKMQTCEFNKLSYLIKQEQIDGLVVENDVTAFKLIEELKNTGFNLPKDLAMIGFDNLPITKLSKPQLSSIGQDFSKLGEEAVNLLLRQINDPDLIFNKQVVVPVKLIGRSSTKGE